MLFLKYLHSAGRCTRTREEESPTSDVVNSIESNVAYLRPFLQGLLGSFNKNTNAKLQDTSLWSSKKNRKTNVWSLNLGTKKNCLKKLQARALEDIFFWLLPKYTQRKVLQVGRSHIWKTSLWSTKKVKNKRLKSRFG